MDGPDGQPELDRWIRAQPGVGDRSEGQPGADEQPEGQPGVGGRSEGQTAMDGRSGLVGQRQPGVDRRVRGPIELNQEWAAGQPEVDG